MLDVERAEVRRNASGSPSSTPAAMVRFASVATVAQMLEREDFRARYQANQPISVVEFLYPLLQGYDSVAVRADIELGGTDQTFNLLMGREVQRAYGQEPQAVAHDAADRGSRRRAQDVEVASTTTSALTEPAERDVRQADVAFPDELIPKYELLCTDLGAADNARVVAGLADGSIHPNEEKRRMARTIVELYHGARRRGRGGRGGVRPGPQAARPPRRRSRSCPCRPRVMRDGDDGSPFLYVPALLEAPRARRQPLRGAAACWPRAASG